MDKQKQIEDMAKIISCDCSIKTMSQCEGFDDCKACRATDLYNAGYRKIPEKSVVLTREEKQKLLHEMYEQGKFDGVVKFAQALENRLDSIDTILHEDNEEEYLSANELGELIDEICKEIIGDEK